MEPARVAEVDHARGLMRPMVTVLPVSGSKTVTGTAPFRFGHSGRVRGVLVLGAAPEQLADEADELVRVIG